MKLILVLGATLVGVTALAQTPPTPQVPSYKWTLEDVKKLADAQNPDLKAARANYEAASATIMEAWSGYLPRVDLGANYIQTNLPDPSAGSTTQLGIVLPYSSAIATVKQTLFDFGKTLAQIGANKAYANSAEQQAMAVHNAIELSVEKSFFSVQSNEKLVAVAQEAVAQFEETRRRTASLVRTGTRPSFDLTQANVELSESRLNLISAQEALDLSRVNLLTILGMPKEVTFKLMDTQQPSVDSNHLNLDVLTEKAFTFRPEIKEHTFGVESAQMNVHREIRDYLPTLNLEGWYAQYMPNYPTSIAQSWGGGVTLTWNIFNGLDTTSKVREYSARLEQQSAELEKEREVIVAEVAQSFLELKKSQKNLDVTKEAYDFAVENSRLAKQRYEANVATFLELLVAETSLIGAEAVEVQARFQYYIAIATLQTAVNAPLE